MVPRVWSKVAGLALAVVSVGAPLHADAAVAADPALQVSVQAPYFGDVLYNFYQQQYFSALTSLMVSQQAGRLKPNEADAELLRGGMLLANGLHREAGQVFERLAERGVDSSTRRRAWFLLAKSRYQRGLAADALAALARIDGPLPGSQEDQRTLLQAQSQMALGQFSQVAETLRAIASRGMNGKSENILDEETERSSRYARFNLGVALIRGGDSAAGMRWLDELGQAPAGDEEMRALRDQANVALGFAAIQANEPEKARSWLERVRLKGSQANKALLGFGWAALMLKEPKQALVPWEELVSRDPGDAAVLEARLAFPYALAQAGETSSALAQYEQALRHYDEEGQRLNESIVQLRDSAWLNEALTLKAGEELGWTTATPRLPKITHAAHFDAVMSRHEFQEGFKDQHDLVFLQQNLADWQQRLDSHVEALKYRRETLAPRLNELKGRAAKLNQVAASQRLAKMEAAVQAEAANSSATLQRLNEAQDRVRKLQAELTAMQTASQQALKDMAVNVLVQQQERLAGYTTQARFGLAQMYDRALKDTSTQEGSRATSR